MVLIPSVLLCGAVQAERDEEPLEFPDPFDDYPYKDPRESWNDKGFDAAQAQDRIAIFQSALEAAAAWAIGPTMGPIGNYKKYRKIWKYL